MVGDLAKRLIGADPRILLAKPRDPKTQILSQLVGLKSPNLIGSSDVDFHKDSESGFNSKITFGTKESFSRTTVELPACSHPPSRAILPPLF